MTPLLTKNASVRATLLFAATVLATNGCAPEPGTTPESALHTSVLEPTDQGNLEQRVSEVLSLSNFERTLSTEVNAAWQIMHAVICYGHDLEIKTLDRGQVGALDYIFSGGMMRGMELRLSVNPLKSTGRVGVKAKFDPGSYIGQGHVDQWLAICAMADIPMNTQIQIGGFTATLEDWARQTQFDVSNNPINEFSWTLIALTHYFPKEPSWISEGDIEVTWEMLVEEELRYELSDSACGGTHRMAGIVAALRAAEKLGIAKGPVWKKARERVDGLLTSTRENRAADGRLSSFYFTRAGNSRDLFAELSGTGHVFEFVALASSQEELESEWVERSAAHLCGLIENMHQQKVDCGALYHALNGLRVYHKRRWQSAGASTIRPAKTDP